MSKKCTGFFAYLTALYVATAAQVLAEGAPTKAVRDLPAREIPVPASASPELQKILSYAAYQWPAPPKTAEEWKAFVAKVSEPGVPAAKLREEFGVTVESRNIGGVHCYVLTPKVVATSNRHRLLFDLHYGGFIWGGEFGSGEATVMAALLGYKAIAVDYRLLPDHPFPAAMDDAMAVWKEVVKSTSPKNIALVGGSVGGGLVLSLVQRAKREGLPLPGAVLSASPAAADLSKTGDTLYTNKDVDGSIYYDGFWEAAWKLYANGRDLKDPLISPLYGDFKGFPPTYLVSGTRDVWLSDTVRVQHKLLEAQVPTQLEVIEGLNHPGYIMADVPEVKEIYTHVARFLDAHLGN